MCARNQTSALCKSTVFLGLSQLFRPWEHTFFLLFFGGGRLCELGSLCVALAVPGLTMETRLARTSQKPTVCTRS